MMAEIRVFRPKASMSYSRRIPDQQTLMEISEENRQTGKTGEITSSCSTVHLAVLLTQDARIKLKKLYPSSND